MAYTGKKPIDHTDVTQSQSMTVTDDLTVDTNTLHVDSTNNRVGIGTISPTQALELNFTGYGGMVVNSTDNAGQAAIRFDSTSGAQFNQVQSAHMEFRTADTERMRIDSSGNVGIGSTSPHSELDVRGAGEIFTVQGDGGASAEMNLSLINGTGNKSTIINFGKNLGTSDRYLGRIIYEVDNNNMDFYTNGSIRMRIDSSSNVTVGTTTALGQITSLSDGTKFQYAAHNTDSSGAGQTSFRFMRNSADVGSITTTASNTAFNTSSDYRLKENVTGITNGITRVKQLNPSRFNFIIEPDKTVDGFLAHEAQTVVPEAVTGTQDAMRDEEYEVTSATGDIFTPASAATFDEDGNELTAAVDEVVHSTDVEQPDELADGQEWRETTAAVFGTRSVPDYQGIDQSKLVPLLTAALKEAIAKIETLETENATQATQIADLITRVTALEAE